MGFVESRNLVVDQRSLDLQQFPAMAREFAAANFDLLVAGGPAIKGANDYSRYVHDRGLRKLCGRAAGARWKL